MFARMKHHAGGIKKAGNNKLSYDIARGFARYFRRRGIPAPKVSATTLEQPGEYFDYAQRRGGL